MRRTFLSTAIALAGLVLLAVPRGRGPSIEQMFVARTQAAAHTENVCVLPGGDDFQAAAAQEQSPAAAQAARLTVPTASDTSADLPPVRMVVDPYPSFNGVVVDPASDLVMMSDTNRKSLLLYPRLAGSPTSTEPATPVQQIMGPQTGVGFVAGVAMDPVHRELFTVNNDVEDRMVVFDYDARGNVKPKRLLYVPHQSWGIAFNRKRDEIALSVQTPNMFVVFKRDAQKFDAPIRSVRGPKTEMADPHGIYFDETHNEVFVANHGNFRPGELITSYTAYDARESRQERTGNAFSENGARPLRALVADGLRRRRERGRRAARTISGPAEPDRLADGRRGRRSQQRDLRREQRRQLGPRVCANRYRQRAAEARDPRPGRPASRARWASRSPRTRSGSRTSATHTALVFPRLAAGNVAPRRILRNAPAGKETSGFGNPYAVAYDTKRKEILVPN